VKNSDLSFRSEGKVIGRRFSASEGATASKRKKRPFVKDIPEEGKGFPYPGLFFQEGVASVDAKDVSCIPSSRREGTVF